MKNFLRREYLQVMIVSSLGMLSPTAFSNAILIDDYYRQVIKACSLGFPSSVHNFDRFAPGWTVAEHPNQGQCGSSTSNWHFGPGGEHDYVVSAPVTNSHDALAYIRANWYQVSGIGFGLQQATLLTLPGDSLSFLSVYDGNDNFNAPDTASINAFGLNGFNFGENNVLRFRIMTTHDQGEIRVKIYEDVNNYSEITQLVPDTNYSSLQVLDIPLSSFIHQGSGADFSSVEAIEVEFVNNAPSSTDGTINLTAFSQLTDVVGVSPETQSPDAYDMGHHAFSIGSIYANQMVNTNITSTIVGDVNGDSDIDSHPTDGDTVKFTVTLTNPADLSDIDATGVVYKASFEPGATLVPGSVMINNNPLGSVIVGNNPGDTTVEILNPQIGDGGAVSLSYRAKMDADLSGIVSPNYYHKGSLEADQFAEHDTTEATVELNRFDFDVQMTSSASLEAPSDADLDGFSGAGERVTFTAVIKNEGTSGFNNISFAHPAIINATLVNDSITSTQGSITTGEDPADTTVEVFIGTLAPDASATVTFDVLIDPAFDQKQYSYLSGQGGIGHPSLDFSSLTDDPNYTEVLFDPTVALVDAFPTADPGNNAVALDSDGDGVADEWLPGCDATCQAAAIAAGVLLDAFPDSVEASLDEDQDGFPDTFKLDECGGDLATCETNSGLTQDPSLDDTDNDGELNDDDTDDDNDGNSR